MEEFTAATLEDLSSNDFVTVNQTLVYAPRTMMQKIADNLMIGSLFVAMVSLGCTMEVSKIKAHLMRPKGVAIAFVAQFGIMPLTAFSLAKAFQLKDIAAVVVLIIGCCPGGSLSNILSLAMKGDMNLSIVLTSCSTLLALGMMPLLMLVYCQGFDNLLEAMPYQDLIISLLFILVPCGIGIVINHYRPQYSKTITKVGLSASTVCTSVVIVLLVLEVEQKMYYMFPSSILAIAFIMPMVGFVLGYILACLFKLKQAECRTVLIETGCQNAQLCLTLIRLVFPPEVVGPLIFFPLCFVFGQLTEALILAALFRMYQCWQQRKHKEHYQAADPEEVVKQPEETDV